MKIYERIVFLHEWSEIAYETYVFGVNFFVDVLFLQKSDLKWYLLT
jgi:hypothetical protein